MAPRCGAEEFGEHVKSKKILIRVSFLKFRKDDININNENVTGVRMMIVRVKF